MTAVHTKKRQGLDEFATGLSAGVARYDANGLGNEIDWLGLTYNARKIRTKPEGERYLDIAEPWQYFYDWLFYNFPRIYVQLARGHDKTERGAWWSLLWGLSRGDGQALCCGTDKENAKLYLHAVKWQVKHHPDLFQGKVRVNNYDVKFSNGTLIRVIPVNEGGSFGHTPDLLMVNDFHAWTNQEFWDNLWSACGKRKNNRIWIESNALSLGKAQTQWIRPFREVVKDGASEMTSFVQDCNVFNEGTDQEYRRGRATKGPRWFFAAPKGMHASWQWHQMAEWKASMLPNAYKRLINNEDTADGDQFLTPEQYEACEENNLSEPHVDSKRLVCVDMATTQDAAVVSLVSGYRDGDGLSHIELNQQYIWTGSRETPIIIQDVVDKANELSKQYGAAKYCDPWEMRSHVQQDATWNVFEFHVSAHQRSIPLEIYKAATQSRLKVPFNCTEKMQGKNGRKKRMWSLKIEAIDAVLLEKAYGTRLDHKSGGFTDRLMSLGIGVVQLTQGGKLPRRVFHAASAPVMLNGMRKSLGMIIDSIGAPEFDGMLY